MSVLYYKQTGCPAGRKMGKTDMNTLKFNQENEISYYKEHLHAEVEKFADLTILRYQNSKNLLCGRIYFGRSKNSTGYHFNSNERRESWIIEQKNRATERVVARQQRMDEKKNFKHTVKVGDIFVTSWGYDQTNVDFYQVIEVKGKNVIIKEICPQSVPGSGSGMSDDVIALKDQFVKDAEPITKRVAIGNTINLASYKYCSLWDGRPKYRSWYA